MSDRFVFLCNGCHKNECDCIVTQSLPERNIWAGDTYHRRCVPEGVTVHQVLTPAPASASEVLPSLDAK